MALLMLIFSKISDIKLFLDQQRLQGKTIGFVPTMGALHEGHLSLLKKAKECCDIGICSIFVNPTQFNDKSDLARYPRMPQKDTQFLQEANCDVLFLPQESEIYPNNESESFEFGILNEILEAKHRPGHFNGVAQVVKRFFEIIQPHQAFFGSKDYQQVMIIKALVKQLNSSIQIVSCPILRESDGLAMSSRNTLLNAEERKIAALIPNLMKDAKNIALNQNFKAATDFIVESISNQALMKLDYYEICDADSLEQLNHFTKEKTPISLIAVYVGKIRLIDNLVFVDKY